ncbi:hypothetical protein V501_07550 [Pseudogymnoascus sp. VKM F-4519 (FW-2642)]|nr:hypothetical protein V501_07550 [Pseudogymnoascus sp. VKM F-4519 (FW-2642)]
MRFLPIILLAGLVSTSIAAPHPHKNGPAGKAAAATKNAHKGPKGGAAAAAAAAAAAVAVGTGTAAVAANGTAAAAGAVEVDDPNKLDLAGIFGTAVALQGGDIQQDVLFTKSAVGSLEVEFKNAAGRTLTVTENKTPAAPPAGFQALEPSSFKINLAEGADALTLQKVDYVIDAASPDIVGLDIANGQIGKLCTETNTFVIDKALGELEFEADENELTLTVTNMNGEWGIFVPVAAANAAAVAGGDAAAKAAAAKADAAKADAAKAAVAKADAAKADVTKAAAAAKAGEAAVGEEGETDVAGKFNTAVATPAGNQKTDILFTGNEAGNLEVEVNATVANAVTVVNGNPSGNPPTGFLFVDPQSFKISTKSATAATDVVKVDYIFSAAILAAVDPTQGRIGKLDVATNEFVIDGLGEFEFEVEENEWSLTVPDLNGEWAILIPQAAVL